MRNNLNPPSMEAPVCSRIKRAALRMALADVAVRFGTRLIRRGCPADFFRQPDAGSFCTFPRLAFSFMTACVVSAEPEKKSTRSSQDPLPDAPPFRRVRPVSGDQNKVLRTVGEKPGPVSGPHLRFIPDRFQLSSCVSDFFRKCSSHLRAFAGRPRRFVPDFRARCSQPAARAPNANSCPDRDCSTDKLQSYGAHPGRAKSRNIRMRPYHSGTMRSDNTNSAGSSG